MTQSISRRGVLTSVAALPAASMVPIEPMLPREPAAAARVMDAVMSLLEAARTAAADPGVFVDHDVRRAVAIFLKLLDHGDEGFAYAFVTPPLQ